MIDFALRIRWKPRAAKDLERLPLRDQRRVIDAVERYSRTNDGDVQRLVRFTLDRPQRLMTILRVVPRDKAYKVREPEVQFSTEDALGAGIA